MNKYSVKKCRYSSYSNMERCVGVMQVRTSIDTRYITYKQARFFPCSMSLIRRTFRCFRVKHIASVIRFQ